MSSAHKALPGTRASSEERKQIGPRLRATTIAQMEQACRERQCSMSDFLDAAILAFLAPGGPEQKVDLLLQECVTIREEMVGVHRTMAAIVELCKAVLPDEPPPPPIATYEQMYGPMEPVVPVAIDTPESVSPAPSLPVRRSLLQRVFVRESGV